MADRRCRDVTSGRRAPGDNTRRAHRERTRSRRARVDAIASGRRPAPSAPVSDARCRSALDRWLAAAALGDLRLRLAHAAGRVDAAARARPRSDDVRVQHDGRRSSSPVSRSAPRSVARLAAATRQPVVGLALCLAMSVGVRGAVGGVGRPRAARRRRRLSRSPGVTFEQSSCGRRSSRSACWRR